MTKNKVPNFRTCLEMMKSKNPQISENGFHFLRPQANHFIDELLESFESENNESIRCWLLELISEARSKKAFTVLCAQSLSSNENLRSWGIQGLNILATKQARRFLYENQLHAKIN